MSNILADAYGKDKAQEVLETHTNFSEKYTKFDLMNDEHYHSFVRTITKL